eukprot:5744376-Amphidinium_carterae.1
MTQKHEDNNPDYPQNLKSVTHYMRHHHSASNHPIQRIMAIRRVEHRKLYASRHNPRTYMFNTRL